MQGFRSKVDGLVNVGDIARTRVENPKDYVKRDQQVWVKVISLAGGRLRLSMRDVDQKTGKDLLAASRQGEGIHGNPSSFNTYHHLIPKESTLT